MIKHRVVEGVKAKFILSRNKIYVETFTATYVLNPAEGYWTRSLPFIWALIEAGEIRTYLTLWRIAKTVAKFDHTSPLKDVVYVYKTSRDNGEELRYSLRSIQKNLNYKNVIIVGDKPDWIQNVIHIECKERSPNRYLDAEYKWRAACISPAVSDKFYAFNDDFFIMRPTTVIDYSKGLLSETSAEPPTVSREKHLQALKSTRSYLIRQGYAEPCDYELHIPLLVEKTKRLKVSDQILPLLNKNENVLPRSVYGNTYFESCRVREDCKYLDEFNTDYLSTSDQSWAGEMGKFIREKFPEKSFYE